MLTPRVRRQLSAPAVPLNIKPVMSPEVALRRAIARAERILPGKAAPEGECDPRWQAIMKIETFADSQPEPVWEFARRWGKHPQKDLRTAIGVCLVETLMERHFELLFSRVRKAVRASSRLADTYSRAWWYGFAEGSPQRAALEKLQRQCRARTPDKRRRAR